MNNLALPETSRLTLIPDTVLLLVAKIACFFRQLIYNTEKDLLDKKLKGILDQKFNKPVAISVTINSNYQNKSLDLCTRGEKKARIVLVSCLSIQ